MRLVISAFRIDNTKKENSEATVDMYTWFLSDYHVEFCLGMFNGSQEISMVVKGIDTENEANDLAKEACTLLGQSQCLVLDDYGDAWITDNDNHYLETQRCVVEWHNSEPDGDHTNMLDGSYFTLRPYDKALIH